MMEEKIDELWLKYYDKVIVALIADYVMKFIVLILADFIGMFFLVGSPFWFILSILFLVVCPFLSEGLNRKSLVRADQELRGVKKTFSFCNIGFYLCSYISLFFCIIGFIKGVL